METLHTSVLDLGRARLSNFSAVHHGKHPFRMYHSLVWLLLCPRPQETAKGRECSPIHHTNQPPIHWLCLHFPLPRQRTPRTPDVLSSTFFLREKDTKVWGHVPTNSRTASFLLPSDFWMDLPHIKLIFLYTLAMTVIVHSAPFPLLLPYVLYERYVLSVKCARNNPETCDNNNIYNEIKTWVKFVIWPSSTQREELLETMLQQSRPKSQICYYRWF